ncbi:MAG TPA: VIT1/CCC1 family protein [Candidatus Binataceae bacterium]|nr:VIT1/CCC1 family protein [Candidatus Binataceae bacterium]
MDPVSRAAKLRARRYLANLRGEIDSATFYRALSEIEARAEVAKVYRRIAAIEESHAEFWKKRLAGILDGKVPEVRTGLRSRILIWMARLFGPRFILPIATNLERGDSGYYEAQPEAIAHGLPAAERSHARLMEALAAPAPTLSLAALTRLEGRHRMGTATALRAAVLSANDGLVSNLSLVMGVAGAAMTPHAILITGFAGLVAGACAMSLGEWLSIKTSADTYLREIEVQAEEFAQMPEEEREQLMLIYQSKGLSEDEARILADRLISQSPATAPVESTDESRAEMPELESAAWLAAASSFVLFASGAMFPVLPFVFVSGEGAVVMSIALSALMLFVIGAGTTLFTGRGVIFSGGRQMLIGMAAAGVTYALGRLLGVTIAG